MITASRRALVPMDAFLAGFSLADVAGGIGAADAAAIERRAFDARSDGSAVGELQTITGVDASAFNALYAEGAEDALALFSRFYDFPLTAAGGFVDDSRTLVFKRGRPPLTAEDVAAIRAMVDNERFTGLFCFTSRSSAGVSRVPSRAAPARAHVHTRAPARPQ